MVNKLSKDAVQHNDLALIAVQAPGTELFKLKSGVRGAQVCLSRYLLVIRRQQQAGTCR